MPLAICIPICIFGIAGKMGKTLLAAASEDPDVRIVAGTAGPRALDLESTVPLLTIEEALPQCDVAIDFSVQEAALQHILAAQRAQKALVIGTTGLTEETKEAMQKAAQDIPLFYSANFSIGIALCLEMAASASNTLFGQSFIDIFETHHVHKKDRPSGTALALAQAMGKGKIVYVVAEPRQKEEIAIHSTRSGETIGEHHLVFECGFERLEIKHTAHSRLAFAQGALRAAKWLVGQSPGLYGMHSLLKRDHDN